MKLPPIPKTKTARSVARYATEEERQAARRARRQTYRERNRERIREQQAIYYKANRDDIIERAKKRAWEHHIRKTYGLTKAEYEAMLAAQGGQCAICGPNIKNRQSQTKMCIDHDHESGQVRALLCNRCNIILAMADEDPRILASAQHYLFFHKTVPQLREAL